MRCDRPGQLLEDYQTVGLDQSHMREAWTTRHVPATRSGGTSRTGTHIRHRDYLADAVYVVAIALSPAGEAPSVEDCAEAIRCPERPIFLGRKSCLPAGPLFLALVAASHPLSALEALPLRRRDALAGDAEQAQCEAWWLDERDLPRGRTRVAVYDQRDWVNRIHTGRRFIWQADLGANGVLMSDQAALHMVRLRLDSALLPRSLIIRSGQAVQPPRRAFRTPCSTAFPRRRTPGLGVRPRRQSRRAASGCANVCRANTSRPVTGGLVRKAMPSLLPHANCWRSTGLLRSSSGGTANRNGSTNETSFGRAEVVTWFQLPSWARR